MQHIAADFVFFHHHGDGFGRVNAGPALVVQRPVNGYIKTAQGIQFWTRNRRAAWKVASRFVSMGGLIPTGSRGIAPMNDTED